MKKLSFFIALFFTTFTLTAQGPDADWLLNIGFNAVNNLQTQNPVFKPEKWALQNPFAVSVERRISDRFFVEGAFTLNGFEKGSSAIFVNIQEDLTYYSFDVHAKVYYGDQIFYKIDWIDLYLNAGFGYFGIEKSNASFNLGGGILFWLNKKRSLGVRLQTIGKLAFNNKNEVIDGNHYQYHLQAVFKL